MKALTVARKKRLSEEELILRNPEMKAAILESEEAKRRGVKPWKIKY